MIQTSSFQGITTIHTLGPHPTNCERAGEEWFTRQKRRGIVRLHSNLERAAEQVLSEDGSSALLACIVYPKLNELVFRNLRRLKLLDVFIMPTMPMVLAARDDVELTSVATHPAPASLVPSAVKRKVMARSNAEAAELCAAKEVDGCITTMGSVELLHLRVLINFGEVPMGFSVHASSACVQ